jgi:hypothetical protein
MDSPYAETPFPRLLVLWISFHISRIAASMKPRYLASHINADVAASGNPTGA